MSTYYWYTNNGQLKFIDRSDNAVTLDPITVRYRKRLSGEIRDYSDVASDAIVADGTIEVKEDGDAHSWGITKSSTGTLLEIGDEFRFMAAYQLYGESTYTDTDSLYKLSSTALLKSTKTPHGLTWATVAALTRLTHGATFDYTVNISPWEEQDDGLDQDVQLAALYLAVSRASDLAGGDGKTASYFQGRYNNMQKELRRKYNSSKYRDITIRPNQF